jgi:Tfp pilus assembly protein PilF
VYSLGVLVFEMLAKHLPFDAASGRPASAPVTNSRELRPDVPAAADAVLARASAPDPADRYPSAGALAADLRQALAPGTSSIRDADGTHKPRTIRHPMQLFVAAVFLLAVGGIVLLQWPRSNATRHPKAHNPRAVDYFADGSLWLNRLNGREQAVARAESSFRLAIALDPRYAEPHAGLAHAYVTFALGNLGDFEPEKFLLAARREARRALELDSTLAEAHAEEAQVLLFLDMDWAGTERAAGRALELDSGSATARMARIALFEYVGRIGEAIAESREYARLQAQLERPKIEWARALFFDRQYAPAAEQLRRTIERDSAGFRTHLLLGEVLAEQGKYDSAVSEMRAAVRHSNGSSRTRAYLANVYARVGRTAEAQRELNAIYEKSRHGFVPALDFAIAYVGLRDLDSTFAWLNRAIDDHSMRPYVFDPSFDPIRSDSHYEQLLRRMHLPYRPSAR